MSIPGVLAGRTVLLLRSADRAAATIAALRERGARTALCRLIDFELPADTAELDAGLRRLLAGEFDWCVFTSVNTLTALALRARALGLAPAMPAATRIAVVGEATARAVRELGATVDFMPAADHSARGMLAEWCALRAGPASVFMPQADIASSTLRDGFAAHGWDAHIVVAYNTVAAPADPARALDPAGSNQADADLPPGCRLLDAAELAAALPGIDAVFFTSPSTVDRFLAVAPAPGAAPDLVAIGDSTAARLRERGFVPAAVAAMPTPAGMIAAWEAALAASRSG
ncbi:uroporphyrinogen-III synthase [Paeniglutamicibacter sp. NPDC012692]|uniref:uroporphyrinogen-III synthase n=1 Tax=Paeniglutamicibacter sp. NPDC012692 TaxID=3364388 RepID=UPI0036CCA48D